MMKAKTQPLLQSNLGSKTTKSSLQSSLLAGCPGPQYSFDHLHNCIFAYFAYLQDCICCIIACLHIVQGPHYFTFMLLCYFNDLLSSVQCQNHSSWCTWCLPLRLPPSHTRCFASFLAIRSCKVSQSPGLRLKRDVLLWTHNVPQRRSRTY